MLFLKIKYHNYFILAFVGLLLLSLGIICIGALIDGWNGMGYMFMGFSILISSITGTLIAVLIFSLIKYFKKVQ